MFWVLELIKPLTVYCFGNGRWSFFSQPEIIQSPTPWTSWALCSCDEATRYLRHCWERKLPQNLSSCAEGTLLVEKTSVQQGNILWRTFTGHQLSAEMFRNNTDEFQGNSIWHRNQNKIVTVVFCVICHSLAQKDNKSVVHVIAEEGCRETFMSISNSHKHVTSALTCDQHFFSSDCSLIQRWISDISPPSPGISPSGFAFQSHLLMSQSWKTPNETPASRQIRPLATFLCRMFKGF